MDVGESSKAAIERANKRKSMAADQVWDKVFGYLCPSQLARVSMASPYFKAVVEQMEIWEKIANRALPKCKAIPKRKSMKTYYGRIIFKSNIICENCYKCTNGSRAALPVYSSVHKKGINMCLGCRQKHYKEFPNLIFPMIPKCGGKVDIEAQGGFRNKEIQKEKEIYLGTNANMKEKEAPVEYGLESIPEKTATEYIHTGKQGIFNEATEKQVSFCSSQRHNHSI
ncbi:hypothetical protein BDA99DRAFT_563381 [Phascolomyces articulosus]|uniref:F-box domain-containing protein n=1 Tax=Phascolomyces articulosus TaxID=60185 RepID=A0AAD5K3D7_9FUNG|nr:hypothetical protein BDA99DRAFT_563381 [Phascolomyces articulosus]